MDQINSMPIYPTEEVGAHAHTHTRLCSIPILTPNLVTYSSPGPSSSSAGALG